MYSLKNVWLSKLRDTSDRWKRTLQSNTFRNNQQTSHGHKETASGKGGDHEKGTSSSAAAATAAAAAAGAAASATSGGGSVGGGGQASTSSAFGHRLNLNNFQASRSVYSKRKSPPRNLEVGTNQRLSSGSVSINSSLRDNASCSYMFDDSILTTSTFT